jgi:hypothetical protein
MAMLEGATRGDCLGNQEHASLDARFRVGPRPDGTHHARLPPNSLAKTRPSFAWSSGPQLRMTLTRKLDSFVLQGT